MSHLLFYACASALLLSIVWDVEAGTRTDTFNDLVRGRPKTVHPVSKEPPVQPPIRVIENVPQPTVRADVQASKTLNEVTPTPPPPPSMNGSLSAGRGSISVSQHKINASAKQIDLAINPNLSTRERDLLLGAKRQNLALAETHRSMAKKIQAFEARRLDPRTRGITTAGAGQSTVPRNKVERQLWADTLQSPRTGRSLSFTNRDQRFSSDSGWVKRYKEIKVPRSDGRMDLHQVHYQYNQDTGLIADMKMIYRIVDAH